MLPGHVNVPVCPSVLDVPEYGVTKMWPPLAVHADQIQLIVVLLACIALLFWYCAGYQLWPTLAAACSLANSVQPLLTQIIVEPTHPHPGCGQSFAWVFASLVQVLWMSAAATGLVPHPTLWCGIQAVFFDRFFLAGDVYKLWR